MNKTRREITEEILKFISKEKELKENEETTLYFNNYSQYKAIIIKCNYFSQNHAKYYIDIYHLESPQNKYNFVSTHNIYFVEGNPIMVEQKKEG